MNKIGLILIFISHISSGMYAQDLCKKEYGMEKKGQVSIGSTVFEGFIKQGIRYDASEFACNIEYWKTQNLVFTINQQPDLIYFESYYDTTHLHIQSQGYYRLVYLDSEIGYCWLKDLVWNQYSPSGHITKKEFFYKNELKEAPYMPQPSSK